MADPIWTVPEHRPTAEQARRTILQQHERIRALLAQAQDVAERALDGASPSPDAVASAIGDIRATMEVHLTFEDKVLVAILEDDLPLGPQRARALREDHHKQRATLAQLHQEALAAPLLPTLAAKLAFLTGWILEDMIGEEKDLLTPDGVRDDVVTIDQTSG
jgi:Hemerythrin HHE cation binding domain